jgi:flagellar export protein FliJ
MSESKFKFRLASALRVARVREDMEKRRIAVENGNLATAVREEEERAEAYEAKPAPVAGTLASFQAARTVAELRGRALTEAGKNRLEATERLDLVKAEWLQAARRVRSLEELEERHRAAHAMVAARAAQRSLDDLVRMRRAGLT